MKLFLLIATLLLLASCSNKPKTFDDCVLEYVSKAPTVIAANAAYDACKNKFPESKSLF